MGRGAKTQKTENPDNESDMELDTRIIEIETIMLYFSLTIVIP